MKIKIIFTLCIVIIQSSLALTTDYETEKKLVGKWKLKEILNEPGDGSGKFELVIYKCHQPS